MSIISPVHDNPVHDNIIWLFKNRAYEPETISVLAKAYEAACASLYDMDQQQLVKAVLARRILTMAEAGERDPTNLILGALRGLPMKVAP